LLWKLGIALGIGIIILLYRSFKVGGRLEALERRHHHAPERETDRYVEQLIRQNRKSEAIRVYRALHGVDHRTAQSAVEQRASGRRRK
jgi:hypothetical protein